MSIVLIILTLAVAIPCIGWWVCMVRGIYKPLRETETCQQKLWRISQAVKLQRQNDLAGLQQFYDYVKGVVEGQAEKEK